MKNFDRDKEYISEEKIREERLRAAIEAAETSNRIKSEFINRMSHDIRTPLNTIIGMTDLAVAHIDNKKRVQDCLKKISLSGNHLLNLINEILDMNKIESGSLNLKECETNLSDIIDDILAIINPQIYAKNHTLEININHLSHEDIVGDSMRIKEVLMNFLSNAVKYTNDGGKIVMEITEKESHIKDRTCYEFIFRDNGIGMEEEFVKHIFDPFLRAENAEFKPVEGNGLGMAIAKNIVQMMSGDIKVKSVLGQGSEFIVTMHLKYREKSCKEFQKMSVLVVDDMEIPVLKQLKKAGIHCDICKNAKEAVKLVETINQTGRYYNLILCDGKYYAETSEKLKKKLNKNTMILVQMFYDRQEQNETENTENNRFIMKPLFCSKIYRLLEEIVHMESVCEKNIYKESIQGKSIQEDIYKENNKMIAVTEEICHPQKPDFSGCRVLIAEDNDLNLEIASEIIKTTGAEVETAENGLEALKKLENTPPDYFDLIFMDIRMPKMDGYMVANEIRNSVRKDMQNIPIIAMTANAFADDITKSKDAGMNDHIAKPLKMNLIFQTMEKWLSNKVIDEYRKIII